MTFTVTINVDNDAFSDGTGQELARVLNAVATDVSNYDAGYNDIKLKDINGNACGTATWSE